MIIGLIATTSVDKHRHIGQVGVVLKRHHSEAIHLGHLKYNHTTLDSHTIIHTIHTADVAIDHAVNIGSSLLFYARWQWRPWNVGAKYRGFLKKLGNRITQRMEEVKARAYLFSVSSWPSKGEMPFQFSGPLGEILAIFCII